jgi:hypothetical protein
MNFYRNRSMQSRSGPSGSKAGTCYGSVTRATGWGSSRSSPSSCWPIRVPGDTRPGSSPSVCLTIHLINVLRIAALCIIVTIDYELLNFNHDYTFYVIVYGWVFLLWWIWVKRFSPPPAPPVKVPS